MTPLFIIPELFGVSIEVYFLLILLFVPTYFFWRWLLKKFIADDKSRKIATLTATIFSTPFIYMAMIALWIMSISYYPTADFDKQKWQNDIEKRYELTDDLIDNEVLIGKSMKQVKKLLGDDYEESGIDRWSYYVGTPPGLFGIDPDYLDIDFKNGRVVHVSQHTS